MVNQIYHLPGPVTGPILPERNKAYRAIRMARILIAVWIMPRKER
jgi:hypothetical protein